MIPRCFSWLGLTFISVLICLNESDCPSVFPSPPPPPLSNETINRRRRRESRLTSFDGTIVGTLFSTHRQFFVASTATFGGALLGITYGVLSASWEPSREGTFWAGSPIHELHS